MTAIGRWKREQCLASPTLARLPLLTSTFSLGMFQPGIAQLWNGPKPMPVLNCTVMSVPGCRRTRSGRPSPLRSIMSTMVRDAP